MSEVLAGAHYPGTLSLTLKYKQLCISYKTNRLYSISQSFAGRMSILEVLAA